MGGAKCVQDAEKILAVIKTIVRRTNIDRYDRMIIELVFY